MTQSYGLVRAPTPVLAPRRPGAKRARLPALDGLRGIGIAAVVAYHLNPSWLPGGYLGVDIFFVVSGFLITGLLLDLLGPGSATGPALRRFWARRARRLVPGLIVLLFGTAVAASFFAHDAVPELRADIPAALGFVANWRLLLHHDNYFQAIGRPPLLQHLWSLGVEEQFYLLWPFVVLLVILAARRRPASALCWVSWIGAVGSALLMALLFVPGHGSSAVYYDTFTHSSGLLIGAGLAAVTRNRRPARGAPARRRRAQVGAGALGGLVLMLVFLGSGDTFTYRGGIFLASALTGLVLVVCLQRGPVQVLLRARPLRYLGTRSYSLYLWHWPIICLTRPDIDLRLSGWPLLLLRLALIGAAGELSYRLVEQPFRTGRAQAVLRAWRSPGRRVAVGSVGACAATAVVLLAVTNPPPLSAALAAGSTPAARVHLVPLTSGTRPPPITAPTTTTTTTPATTAPGTTVAVTDIVPTTPATASTVPVPSGTAQVPSSTATPSTAGRAPFGNPGTSYPATSYPSTTVAPLPLPQAGLGHDFLAIGDSVLVASSGALEARLGGDIVVDAAVSRQVSTGIARLRAYRQAGDLKALKGLVIDLGTNGPMTPADVAELRALAAGVPILVFVNVRVPRPWQSQTNTSLAAVAGQPGTRVVNWYAASAAAGSLWPDGVHPDPKGQAIYANLVAVALTKAPVRQP